MVDVMDTLLNTVLLEKDQIAEAVDILARGEILAFPTETVYGLGAPIFNEQAIKKIFNAKGRPSDNPLIAHVSDLSQIFEITKDLPDDFFLLFEEFFPGPLAVVLPKSDKVPLSASAGLSSIAVRMPADSIALELIAKLGQPIVAPSANLSGKPSATCPSHVLDDFQGKIGAIINSTPSQIGIESTVLSLLGTDPIILRPGHITQSQLEDVLQKKVLVMQGNVSGNDPILSPGVKYRHYAPKAPVRLFFSEEELLAHVHSSPLCSRFILSARALPVLDRSIVCPLTTRDLYASLRKSDTYAADEVLIYCDDESVENTGLMNRIQKAAQIFS